MTISETAWTHQLRDCEIPPILVTYILDIKKLQSFLDSSATTAGNLKVTAPLKVFDYFVNSVFVIQ